MPISRRDLLKGAAAAGGLAALGATGAKADPINWVVKQALGEVAPRTPINHTVVLMMENRSVDHYLGWLAKERGTAAFDAVQDQTFLDSAGNPHTSAWWGKGSDHEDYAGCGFEDPGHGWGNGRVQLNGKTFAGYSPTDRSTWADGFLKTGSGNDAFAISYYERSDLPVTSALVDEFTTFDRYFCSVLASTYPNREYQHSAQSGGIDNNDFPPQRGKMTGFDWPTIWTLLDNAGISWAYYYGNAPVIALWGPRHAKNARHVSTYYADCAAGMLPQVCFVDPYFITDQGLANDDHPHADIRLGQEFISDVVTAFIESPHWQKGAFFLNYDEWGGFGDHVPPPKAANDVYKAQGFDQMGFRVPTQLISPFARGGRVDHGVYDHVSILKFIEGNYGLPPLNVRDASATDIGAAFDFGSFNPEVDVAKLRYKAPAEAHIACEARDHLAPASDLFKLVDNGWIEAQGYKIFDSLEATYRR
jgi:phospholipase C